MKNEENVVNGEMAKEELASEVADVAKEKSLSPIVNIPVSFDNAFDMQTLMSTAGTLDIGDEKIQVLRSPISEEDILIRPDGLVYLSWLEYQKRLDKAFGVSWSLVPNGMPKYDSTTNLILWGFTLVISGRFVDFAIGQQEYQSTNRTMTYGDAMEGAKSNALMRCCKRLGIGIELWDKEFVEQWKAKYAYKTTGYGGKTVWLKKVTPGKLISKVVPPEEFSGTPKMMYKDNAGSYFIKIDKYEFFTKDAEIASYLNKNMTSRLEITSKNGEIVEVKKCL